MLPRVLIEREIQLWHLRPPGVFKKTCLIADHLFWAGPDIADPLRVIAGFKRSC